MCNLSDGIYNEGLIKGRSEGLTKGLSEGKNKATLDNLKSIMKNLNLTLDQALKGLGISEDEYSKYEKLINEQA